MRELHAYHWTRVLQLWLLVLAVLTAVGVGWLVLRALTWDHLYSRPIQAVIAEVAGAAAGTVWLVALAVVNLLRRMATARSI